MKIYLIRHGQSYVNLEDWHPPNRAALDAGLTPLGIKQAEALAAWLPQEIPEVTQIYSSSMRRARETVAIIAPGYPCAIQLDHRIREFGNNTLDHHPFPDDSLPESYVYPSRHDLPFTPISPGEALSETFSHFRIRVGQFFSELVQKHPSESILVVSHGGVINAAFDNAFNVGPFRTCNVWNPNTSITHFEYVQDLEKETWHLHFQGKIDHLVGSPQADR